MGESQIIDNRLKIATDIAIIFDTSNQLLTNDFLSVLGFWLLLIVLGTFGVANLLAYKITKPFTLIEKAIASVGEDGILPYVKVTGSPGARALADALEGTRGP